jgi:hypothetical protein
LLGQALLVWAYACSQAYVGWMEGEWWLNACVCIRLLTACCRL